VVRIPYINVPLAQQALSVNQRLADDTRRLIREDPVRLAQTRHNGLADHLESAGLLAYGLGHPLEDVQEHFLQSAQASLRVFELRGTEPRLPVEVIALDRAGSCPDDATAWQPADSQGGSSMIDHSLTNSRDGMRRVHVALASGDYALAEKLSGLLWDPPNATYVGPDSVVCTPNDINLAQALRATFALRKEDLEQNVNKISIRRREDAGIGTEASLMRAIMERQREEFYAGVRELLAWHSKRATRKQYRADPHFFLCLSAIGLSILALRQGVIEVQRLPDDNEYLPLELIRA
jgi:Immunity protein 49